MGCGGSMESVAISAWGIGHSSDSRRSVATEATIYTPPRGSSDTGQEREDGTSQEPNGTYTSDRNEVEYDGRSQVVSEDQD